MALVYLIPFFRLKKDYQTYYSQGFPQVFPLLMIFDLKIEFQDCVAALFKAALWSNQLAGGSGVL